MLVIADYRPSPFGSWTAAVAIEDGVERTAHFADPHEAYHAVLDLLEELVDALDAPLATMHTLDGDPTAWAMLAAREGLTECTGPRTQARISLP
jgi:hypothetical protein